MHNLTCRYAQINMLFDRIGRKKIDEILQRNVNFKEENTIGLALANPRNF